MDWSGYIAQINRLGVSACQVDKAMSKLRLTMDDMKPDTEEQDKKLNNKFFTTKKDERNLSKHKAACQKAKRKRKKK